MNWSDFFRSELANVSVYQAGLRASELKALEHAQTVYKLSSNESPFKPFPSALVAMEQALPGLYEYSDPNATALVAAVAAKHGVQAQNIAIGNGSNELIDLLAHTCLNAGDEVLYCAPSFVIYQTSTLLQGAVPIEVPLNADGAYDLPALQQAITNKTKIIYVCTPNNPTGGMVNPSELNDFIAAVPEHILVVVDAAYEEFANDYAIDAPASLYLDMFDGVRPLVVLKTFSKAFALAGVRCGYAVCPVQIRDALDKVRAPFHVNSLAQAAASACLNDKTELQHRRALNFKGKVQLYQCFERLSIKHFKSAANFIWIEYNTAAEAQQVFERLLSYGIIVRYFAGTTALRVGIGDDDATAATVQAFEEISAI